jgi:cytochrome bd-type quinol oxidase subunit 2
MPISEHLPGYRWFHVFKNLAVRVGLYVGVCLSLVLSFWIFVANRVPFLERFARERNLAGAALLGLLAVAPVLRFLRSPGNLLASSLVAWTIFSLTYRLLCIFFSHLGEKTKYSAFLIFTLGSFLYMILATLSWIGMLIWRVRERHLSHPNNQVS